MQTGSDREVKCPRCKKVIRPPEILASVKPGQILETTGICPRCGKENYFWARQCVRVDCERADRAK